MTFIVDKFCWKCVSYSSALPVSIPNLLHSPLEDALLTGPLEPTNEWYAVAKIAGIKLCQA
jgi:hypothetical protein